MENMSAVVQVILGVAGIIVSIGVPFFLATFRAFREDIKELNTKIDLHISNYDIHTRK